MGDITISKVSHTKSQFSFKHSKRKPKLLSNYYFNFSIWKNTGSHKEAIYFLLNMARQVAAKHDFMKKNHVWL